MYVKIKAEIKEAMKNKDINKKDVFKMVVDKAKSIKKECHPNDTLENIPDETIFLAINRELKQLYQTEVALKDNANSDLYLSTIQKIVILESFLTVNEPKKMTREEVEKEVERILSNTKDANFGMKMKLVMAELKGKADNKVIKEVVETFK